MKREKIEILTEEIMFSMTEIKKFSRENFSAPPGKFRIPPHQFFCLNVLYRNNTLSMSELAEKMAVSNQQLTRIVDSLVENGLVERFTSPENRRVVLVKIGERGRELICHSDEHIKKNAFNILSGLSEEDIEDVTTHVRAIKNILIKLKKD